MKVKVNQLCCGTERLQEAACVQKQDYSIKTAEGEEAEGGGASKQADRVPMGGSERPPTLKNNPPQSCDNNTALTFIQIYSFSL